VRKKKIEKEKQRRLKKLGASLVKTGIVAEWKDEISEKRNKWKNK